MNINYETNMGGPSKIMDTSDMFLISLPYASIQIVQLFYLVIMCSCTVDFLDVL
jgi:hypothetical protein